MTAGGRTFALLILWQCAVWAQAPDGAISGSVRNAATRMPLEGAQVSLIGPTSSGAATDARGTFHFSGLAAGSYSVRIQMPGFTGSDAQRVEVRAGAASEPLKADLFPLARIEGRVTDEDGQAVAGVMVEAAYAPLINARLMLHGRDTEADGRYLITDLYPQDYVLRIWLPAKLRAAGYPAMEFYPGVTEMVQAGSVHVAEGAQIVAFDIKLRRVPLVNLQGRIVDVSKGSPVVEVALDCEPGPLEGSFARRAVDAEGRFHFDGIPAGRHTLLAYRGTGANDLPYTTTVEGGEDEVAIAVPGFADLRGLVKSAAGPWDGLIGIGVACCHYVTPGDGGEFVLAGVPPGEWKLLLESNGLEAGGKKLHVATAQFGAVNALEKPITVTEGGNAPVLITLSSESGRIAGTVEGEAPESGETVVMAERLGGPPELRFQSARTGSDASFLMEGVVPGEYRLSAWAVTLARQGVMGTDCTGGVFKVTVKDGQTSTVKLKRCAQ